MAISRNHIFRVLKQVQLASSQCPCHGSGLHNHAEHQKDTDYAFELATSNIRYGPGVTREVGMDMQNMKAKKGILDIFNKSLYSPTQKSHSCIH